MINRAGQVLRLASLLLGTTALSLALSAPAVAQTVLNGLSSSIAAYDSAGSGDHTHGLSGEAEVGGFANSEIVRGTSEFDISAISGPVTSATLTFRLSELTGCCSQGSFSGTIELVSYVGNNASDLSDFNASSTGTIGTITVPGGAAVGDTYSLNVTAQVNAALSASDASFGVRLARSPESNVDQALTFDTFQLTLNAPPAEARPVPTLSLTGLLALSGLIVGFAAVRARKR